MKSACFGHVLCQNSAFLKISTWNFVQIFITHCHLTSDNRHSVNLTNQQPTPPVVSCLLCEICVCDLRCDVLWPVVWCTVSSGSHPRGGPGGPGPSPWDLPSSGFSGFLRLTRAWPGSQPNAIDRGGGRITPPPQANSQTNDRSETGEAALERSRRDGSKALLTFFLKGHVSGQGQVKGQNWAFQHFGSKNRQLDSNRPKLGRNTLRG